ncbi:cation:proton antiporter [Streptomyces griseoincarnatus]
MSHPVPIIELLLSVTVVIVACRAGAVLMRLVGQPQVIGEIVTGVALGPTLLGRVWPAASDRLFPDSVVPTLDVLGQLGLLVFMLLLGIELDLASVRGNGRTAAAVSQAGIVLPFALGAALAYLVYDAQAPEGVSRAAFVLFFAVALSITAFPVLARILVERQLFDTPLGALAMTCAAVGDVVAWCMLTLVVALVGSGSPLEALTTGGWAVLLTVGMLVVVRPFLARLLRRGDGGKGGAEQDGTVVIVLFSGMCLSALATEAIGVHLLFGAFLFGLAVPRHSVVVQRSAERLGGVAVALLLPLFFVSTGLRTDFGAYLSGPEQWLLALAVTVVAVVGKWGGVSFAARLCRHNWREALSLGALMNCRGLTELVALNIGLDLGVLSRETFSVLVLTALVTTVATAPALSLLGHRGRRRTEPDGPPTVIGEDALPSGTASVTGRREGAR